MIKYNTEVNLQNIKEEDILLKIDKIKIELHSYGMSDYDICNYDVDLYTDNIDIILKNISICELLWYNNVYKEYCKYKNSLHKIMHYNIEKRLDENTENINKNSFFTTMNLIIQKYGKELIDEL